MVTQLNIWCFELVLWDAVLDRSLMEQNFLPTVRDWSTMHHSGFGWLLFFTGYSDLGIVVLMKVTLYLLDNHLSVFWKVDVRPAVGWQDGSQRVVALQNYIIIKYYNIKLILNYIIINIKSVAYSSQGSHTGQLDYYIIIINKIMTYLFVILSFLLTKKSWVRTQMRWKIWINRTYDQ